MPLVDIFLLVFLISIFVFLGFFLLRKLFVFISGRKVKERDLEVEEECLHDSDFPDILYFKNAEAAFKTAYEFMDCKLEAQKLLPAIVMSAEPGKDGLQVLEIKLATENGPQHVPFCTTLDKDVPHLYKGDFVGFIVAEHHPKLGFLGPIGFVTCKLKAAYNLKKSGWLIDYQ